MLSIAAGGRAWTLEPWGWILVPPPWGVGRAAGLPQALVLSSRRGCALSTYDTGLWKDWGSQAHIALSIGPHAHHVQDTMTLSISQTYRQPEQVGPGPGSHPVPATQCPCHQCQCLPFACKTSGLSSCTSDVQHQGQQKSPAWGSVVVCSQTQERTALRVRGESAPGEQEGRLGGLLQCVVQHQGQRELAAGRP